jgi:hypothetical protein
MSEFVGTFTDQLAKFDWRVSSTPELTDSERRAKLVFRGSSGYRELRAQLIEVLRSGEGEVADAARRL